MNDASLEFLEEIRNSLKSFIRISRKYASSHGYYKENLKLIKLKINSFIIKSQNKSASKKIRNLLLDFYNMDKPSSEDCSQLIDSLDYKIVEIKVLNEDNLTERIYDKNSPFDFHIDIKSLFEKSKKELFVVEPFITEHLLEITLRDIDKSVKLRILTNTNNADKRGKFSKISNIFKSRQTNGYEVRESTDVHDRCFFVDSLHGWVLGQSIKDAGKKPTYLIKLQNPKKLESIYESIWGTSKKIN